MRKEDPAPQVWRGWNLFSARVLFWNARRKLHRKWSAELSSRRFRSSVWVSGQSRRRRDRDRHRDQAALRVSTSSGLTWIKPDARSRSDPNLGAGTAELGAARWVPQWFLLFVANFTSSTNQTSFCRTSLVRTEDPIRVWTGTRTPNSSCQSL